MVKSFLDERQKSMQAFMDGYKQRINKIGRNYTLEKNNKKAATMLIALHDDLDVYAEALIVFFWEDWTERCLNPDKLPSPNQVKQHATVATLKKLCEKRNEGLAMEEKGTAQYLKTVAKNACYYRPTMKDQDNQQLNEGAISNDLLSEDWLSTKNPPETGIDDPDYVKEVEDIAFQKADQKLAEDIVDRLPAEQRAVLLARFDVPNYKEVIPLYVVAERLGISVTEAYKRHKAGLKRTEKIYADMQRRENKVVNNVKAAV